MNNALAANNEIEEMNNWTITGTDGKPYRRGDLDNLFKQVQDSTNWKLPVDAATWLTVEEIPAMVQAVIFFTGSVPVVKDAGFKNILAPNKRLYTVRAEGYYAAVGA